MAKVIVIYRTKGGATEKMAEHISASIREEGVKVDLKIVGEVAVKSLVDYDGIIIGTPVHYGGMASEIKQLIDDSVAVHSELDGKVGGAFASSANIGGGNETAIHSILQAMLVHGMIIQGDPYGDHYGPASIDDVDVRTMENCKVFGRRFAALVNKLA